MSEFVTVYFFGDSNCSIYERQVTTVEAIKRWMKRHDSRLNDVAFCYRGHHPELHSYQIAEYEREHLLVKMQPYQFR